MVDFAVAKLMSQLALPMVQSIKAKLLIVKEIREWLRHLIWNMLPAPTARGWRLL
jgi:hypothetical protein